MSGKKRRISMKNQIVFALREIKEKYKKIRPEDIQGFSPIYYPIAIVEMNLEEMTFEDFETVQLTVLKLIGLGQVDEEVLADLLGLSRNYIARIKHLLRGYGHIEDDRLTELGERSILEEKKIRKSTVWQKFQADALNASLIRMDKIISDNMLNDKDETRILVGHLDYMDGVSRQAIEEQIQEGSYANFIRQKTGILNTNVLAINHVKCSEVKYALCFLMKLRGFPEPVIFAKRYNEGKREIRDRFSWQPFSLSQEELRGDYGFEEEIPLAKQMTREYVGDIYRLIGERAEKLEMEKEIFKTLKRLYPFEEGGISLGGYNEAGFPLVNIKREALKKQIPWLKIFMKEIEEYGEYLITDEHLYGKMIALRLEGVRPL